MRINKTFKFSTASLLAKKTRYVRGTTMYICIYVYSTVFCAYMPYIHCECHVPVMAENDTYLSRQKRSYCTTPSPIYAPFPPGEAVPRLSMPSQASKPLTCLRVVLRSPAVPVKPSSLLLGVTDIPSRVLQCGILRCSSIQGSRHSGILPMQNLYM